MTLYNRTKDMLDAINAHIGYTKYRLRIATDGQYCLDILDQDGNTLIYAERMDTLPMINMFVAGMFQFV